MCSGVMTSRGSRDGEKPGWGKPGFLKRMGRKVDVRLAALFTAIVLAISLFLAGFTFFLLSSSLKRKDQETLRAKVLELYAHYRSGGVAGVAGAIASGGYAEEREGFFIQLRDRWDNDVFTVVPGFLRGFDVERIKLLGKGGSGRFLRVRLSNGKRHVLETVLLRLPDGNYLQVGMGIDERLAVLERFRHVTLLVLIPLIALSFAGGGVIASRALRPLRRLGATVRSVIDTGNIKARIPQEGRGSELDDLIVLFNGMLGRIESLVDGMRGALDSVAHELRTPMARLRGISESALGSDAGPGRLREALETGMEESEKALTMLNVLMDVSEAETGIMRLNRMESDLGSVVRDVAELYGFAAEEKGVSISTSVPPQGLTAFVDPARIRQAFANLLDNAVKYTPRGGSVRVEAFDAEGEVVVSVEDSGIGIRGDELGHVWERLYRGENARSQPGLGLGLSLVKAVVEAHGGRVKAQSEPGKGSRFTVRLLTRP